MKKRILPAVLCLVLLLAVSAQAAAPRAVTGRPSLTFSGTTATCVADVKSDSSSDRLSVTLTLYQGSTVIDAWSASGNGRARISETCSVKKGTTYTLTMTYTLNGVTQPAVSVSGTCN